MAKTSRTTGGSNAAGVPVPQSRENLTDSDLRVGGALAAAGLTVASLTATAVSVGELAHTGATLGFFGTDPATVPTVTGFHDDGSALASLLDALAGLGLIVDESEPTDEGG